MKTGKKYEVKVWHYDGAYETWTTREINAATEAEAINAAMASVRNPIRADRPKLIRDYDAEAKEAEANEKKAKEYYDQAIHLEYEKKYDQAATYFYKAYSCGEKGAFNSYRHCVYLSGMEIKKKGDYLGAAEAFDEGEYYSDCEECILVWAKDLINNKTKGISDITNRRSLASALSGRSSERSGIEIMESRKEFNKEIAELLSEYYYLNGKELMNQKKYEEASEQLEKIGITGYKDAAELKSECYYLYGKTLISQEEYEAAAKQFEKIGITGYKDTAELISECYYLYGIELLKQKKYEGASKQFEKIKGYKDTAELISECHYSCGIVLLKQEKYEEASKQFEKIKRYKDSSELFLECCYLYGNELLKQKKYEEASKRFEKIKGYKDSAVLYLECYYLYGNDLMKKKKYEKASEQFKIIKGYKDAAELISECCYLHGNELLKQKKYEGASKQFEIIKGYKDAEELWKECWYSEGKLRSKAGRYNEATDAFAKIGSFKNASLLQIYAKIGGFIDEHKDVARVMSLVFLIAGAVLVFISLIVSTGRGSWWVTGLFALPLGAAALIIGLIKRVDEDVWYYTASIVELVVGLIAIIVSICYR